MQTLKGYAIGAFAAATLVLAGLGGAGSALGQTASQPESAQEMQQAMREMMDHCTAHMDRMGDMGSMMGS